MHNVIALIKSGKARLTVLLLVALAAELLMHLAAADVSVSYHVEDSEAPSPPGREISFLDPDGIARDRQIRGTIRLKSILPAFFLEVTVGVDDCVSEFSIPALSFSLTGPPYCNYRRPLTLEGLALKLKPGVTYQYYGRTTNFGGLGRFSINVIQSPLIHVIGVISCSILSVAVICLFFGISCRDRTLLTALSIGTLVRVAYFYSHELGVRSHDLGGHLQYIQHVLNIGTVPHPGAGWEFHQPPLYYFILAALARVYSALSGTAIDIPLIGRVSSLIFSCMTLTFILKTMALLPVPAARARFWVQLLMLFVATFPNLVFCTMSLNNDIMLFALVSYTLYLVVKTQLSGEHPSLLTKVLTSAGAILIKTNGVVIVFFWILIDFFASGSIKRSVRLKSTAIMVFAFALVALAQISFRYEQSFILSPFYRESIGLGPDLVVENSLLNFLTFNPLRVFYDTYVEIWNERLHRSMFWEHLIRNFLFGEYNHGDYVLAISRVLLFLWMVVLGLMGLQAAIAPMTSLCRMLLLLLAVTFTLFISFRISYPYSCHQDARFLPPLFCLLPVLLADRMNSFYSRYLADVVAIEDTLIPFWEAALAAIIVLQVAFLMLI